jgi:hypothetical protein
MKHPPVQYTDDVAFQMTEEFINSAGHPGRPAANGYEGAAEDPEAASG